MRIAPRTLQLDPCPPELLAIGFSGQSRFHLSLEKSYDVHAVSLFRRVLFMQVVNDVGIIDWIPALMCHVTESEVPGDWICSLFEGDLALVMGPEFMAKDESSYKRMMELDPGAVSLFWSRIEALKRTNVTDELDT
jgi:hypothetical protein